MCGLTGMVQTGSSPRGRGTQLLGHRHIADERFIPAWAGNTRIVGSRISHCSVHPRVGGEHFWNCRAHRKRIGSSPRGRGTRVRRRDVQERARFIPAWAGNTAIAAAEVDAVAVHPRVGGEHESLQLAATDGVGSSPRGRGTRSCPDLRAPHLRFIPAWAGNTGKSDVDSDARTVHPRVGGEHLAPVAAVFAMAGSSPRGRGTLRDTLYVGL